MTQLEPNKFGTFSSKQHSRCVWPDRSDDRLLGWTKNDPRDVSTNLLGILYLNAISLPYAFQDSIRDSSERTYISIDDDDDAHYLHSFTNEILGIVPIVQWRTVLAVSSVCQTSACSSSSPYAFSRQHSRFVWTNLSIMHIMLWMLIFCTRLLREF